MNFSPAQKQRIAGFRALFLGVLTAALSALLVAAPASAEKIDAGGESPAVESPAIAAQPETSAAVATPEPSAPEPVEIQEITSEATSVVASPGPAVEEHPAVRTLSESPVANPPVSTSAADSVVDRVAPSASAIVDSVDSAPTKLTAVSAPAGVRLDAGPVSDSRHRLSELAQGIARGPIHTAALAADRLPAVLANSALQPSDLLNSIAAMTDVVAAPNGPFGLLPAGGESSANGPMSFPSPARAGLFGIQGAIAAVDPTELYAMETGESVVGKIGALSSGNGEPATTPGARVPSPFLFHHHAAYRVGSPAPSDVPLPTPESPATVVSDSGGTSFVPIVALLALLALVAPTALRRLGRAADFRAPSPFICALERPG